MPMLLAGRPDRNFAASFHRFKMIPTTSKSVRAHARTSMTPTTMPTVAFWNSFNSDAMVLQLVLGSRRGKRRRKKGPQKKTGEFAVVGSWSQRRAKQIRSAVLQRIDYVRSRLDSSARVGRLYSTISCRSVVSTTGENCWCSCYWTLKIRAKNPVQ